jgi:hypothetical protein
VRECAKWYWVGAADATNNALHTSGLHSLGREYFVYCTYFVQSAYNSLRMRTESLFVLRFILEMYKRISMKLGIRDIRTECSVINLFGSQT